MEIIAGGVSVAINTIMGERKFAGGAIRESLRLYLTRDITEEQINALLANEWHLMDDDGTELSVHSGYTMLGSHEMTFYQEDTLERENAALQDENTKLGATIPVLVEGKPASVALPFWKYFPEWNNENWPLNKNLRYNNYPYFVFQAHDSTDNPLWNPEAQPALFSPWHATDKANALPWKAPTGSHDIYKVGEHMIFTDGKIYKALQNTNFSPTDYAAAWELVP